MQRALLAAVPRATATHYFQRKDKTHVGDKYVAQHFCLFSAYFDSLISRNLSHRPVRAGCGRSNQHGTSLRRRRDSVYVIATNLSQIFLRFTFCSRAK